MAVTVAVWPDGVQRIDQPDLREARDALAAVPAWKLGDPVVESLKTTTDRMIEGVNLIILGAQQLSGPLIEEGVAILAEATDAKLEAAAALVELQQETGVGCF